MKLGEFGKFLGKSYATAAFSMEQAKERFLASPLNPFACWVYTGRKYVQDVFGTGQHYEIYAGRVATEAEIPTSAIYKEEIADGTLIGVPYKSEYGDKWFQESHTCNPAKAISWVGYPVGEMSVLIPTAPVEVPAP